MTILYFKESFFCVLCTRRESLQAFLDLLKDLFCEAVAFPL